MYGQLRSVLACSIAAATRLASVAQKAGDKIRTVAALVQTVDEIGDEFGIRVANKRISVTPVSLITEGTRGDFVHVARSIDDAAGSGRSGFHRRIFGSGPKRSDSFGGPVSRLHSRKLSPPLNVCVHPLTQQLRAQASTWTWWARSGESSKDAAERTRDPGGLAAQSLFASQTRSKTIPLWPVPFMV